MRHDRGNAQGRFSETGSNHYECQSVCPKGIKVSFIAKLNREYVKSVIGKP